jgi:TonB family protein
VPRDGVEVPVHKSLRSSAPVEQLADALERQARTLGLRAARSGPNDLRLEGPAAVFDVFMSRTPGDAGYTHAMLSGREVVTRGRPFQDVGNTLVREVVGDLEEADAWALMEPDFKRGSTWCWAASEATPERFLPSLPDAHEEADTYPEIEGGIEALTREVVYPDAARRVGIEGRVFVTFLVTEEGRADCLQVRRGLPGGLSEAAADAVERMRYRPGEVGTETARVWITVPVSFQLR